MTTDETEPPSKPRLTRKRADELLAELSLIDLTRLVLYKADAPDGLDASSAATMSAESTTCKVTVRRLPKKKKRA